MLADLEQLSREARRYTGYLVGGYSADARCGSAAATRESAAIELVNSLSLGDHIVVPRRIESVAFAVDLREYAWDRDIESFTGGTTRTDDGWHTIAADAGPYAIEFVGPEADELRHT